MRNFRTLAAASLAALVGLAAVVAGPSVASTATSTATSTAEQAKPERLITERPPDDHQVAYNAFELKGKVQNPQADGSLLPYQGRVLLTKKTCRACSFRTVRKVRVNDRGVFRARLVAPERGRWTWRVKVKSNETYATTYGKKWTTGF